MALPAELVTAIDNAAKTYGIDPSYLVRIWAIESGSTYPNAVNNSGCGGPNTGPPYCGGLFGLQQGVSYGSNPPVDNIDSSAASVQNQANSAAQALSMLIQQHGGSVYDAMLAYSGSANEAAFVAGGTSPTSYTAGSSSGLTSGLTAGSNQGTLNSLSGSFGALLNGVGSIGGTIPSSLSLGGALQQLEKGTLAFFITTFQSFFDSGAFWDPLFVLVGLGVMGLGIFGTMTGQSSTTGTLRVASKGALIAGGA